MARPSQSSPKADRYPNRFKPGQSGNPGGRAKGLAAAVREKAPADQLADYMLAIWTRDPDALKRHKIDLADVTLVERTKALEWLSDRGYGKAAAFAPVEGGDPLELSDVDRAIAAIVDELAGPREAKASGRAAISEVGKASEGGATSTE